LDSRMRRSEYPLKANTAPKWIVVLAALTLALLLTACSTTAAPTTDESVIDEFSTEESLAGGGETAGATIANIRFGKHEQFERLVIDFATEQSSADAVPQWRLVKAAAEGVLRVHLPTTQATAFTDAALAGALLTRVFVVRTVDGSLFVDVFIPSSFRYRVLQLGNPVRLVIDVAADGSETYALPAVSKLTVLVSPRAGATVQSPISINGYSRHFEANNVMLLRDSEGNEIVSDFTTSTDYIETWGAFSAELTYPARTGAVNLLVGEFSANDGDFEGVTIPVQLGGE
jgi:hypothetical protein